MIDRPLPIQECRQLVACKPRAEQGAPLTILVRRRSRLVEELMPDEERDAERTTGVCPVSACTCRAAASMISSVTN